jgi:hypothetical protein
MFSQLNGYSYVQRTLLDVGGSVAGLGTHLGTDYGCWPAQRTAELRGTDRTLKLPLCATLSLG